MKTVRRQSHFCATTARGQQRAESALQVGEVALALPPLAVAATVDSQVQVPLVESLRFSLWMAAAEIDGEDSPSHVALLAG